jgi:hypothetical protein
VDVPKVLARLRTELRSIEEVIIILERLAARREAGNQSVRGPKAGLDRAGMESATPEQSAAKGE